MSGHENPLSKRAPSQQPAPQEELMDRMRSYQHHSRTCSKRLLPCQDEVKAQLGVSAHRKMRQQHNKVLLGVQDLHHEG